MKKVTAAFLFSKMLPSSGGHEKENNWSVDGENRERMSSNVCAHTSCPLGQLARRDDLKQLASSLIPSTELIWAQAERQPQPDDMKQKNKKNNKKIKK